MVIFHGYVSQNQRVHLKMSRLDERDDGMCLGTQSLGAQFFPLHIFPPSFYSHGNHDTFFAQDPVVILVLPRTWVHSKVTGQQLGLGTGFSTSTTSPNHVLTAGQAGHRLGVVSQLGDEGFNQQEILLEYMGNIWLLIAVNNGYGNLYKQQTCGITWETLPKQFVCHGFSSKPFLGRGLGRRTSQFAKCETSLIWIFCLSLLIYTFYDASWVKLLWATAIHAPRHPVLGGRNQSKHPVFGSSSGFVWKCWVYSQWNSHLIGIMIINHWV